MKNKITFLIITIQLLTFSNYSFTDQTVVEITNQQQNPILGDAWVNQIQSDYAKGLYGPRLAEIEKSYEDDFKNENFPSDDPEMVKMCESILPILNKQAEEISSLHQKAKIPLSAIAKTYPHAFASQVVNAYVAYQPHLDEKKADNDLQQDTLYFYKGPQSPALKKIKEIALEYHHKFSSAEKTLPIEIDPYGMRTAGPAAFKQMKIDRVILEIEEKEKMLLAAQKLNDPKLILLIEKAQNFGPSLWAHQYNLRLLRDFANPWYQPSNLAEEQVGQLMRKLSQAEWNIRQGRSPNETF